MQAVLRQAVGELARGFSTGLAIWAGSHCPPCAPTLQCAEAPRLPDCHCYGGSTPPPALAPSGGSFQLVGWLVAAFLLGWAARAAEPCCRTCPRRPGTGEAPRAVGALPAPAPCVPEAPAAAAQPAPQPEVPQVRPSDALALGEEAQRILSAVRRRHGGGR